MKEVVPDIRIDVEFAATDRWLKTAKPVLDENGRLCLWSPVTAEAAKLSPASS
jgi:hypothetical protein